MNGRERVGIATTTRYGRRIGWIGNVVVKKQYRQRHIGQRLVEHAINHLAKAHVRNIVLYCFKENVPFYRKLGFVQGPRFVRLRREAERNLPTRSSEGSSKSLTVSSVFALDKKAFGADRRKLITTLLNEGFAWYIGYQAGDSASYVLVKSYDDMNEIGPWISFGLDSREKSSLLEHVIRRSGRKPIEVTCPLTNGHAIRMMMQHNFHTINEGRVMFFKHMAGIGRPRAIVAYGFLDKG